MVKAENCPISVFHYSDFSDLEALVLKKEKAGATISVVIPALNEAETIGAIVSSVRESLMERARLVDEIVIMNSGSHDKTRLVAERAGATVYDCDDIGPSLSCAGKGTALWKSQFAASGEILVFLDADIVNFGAHFVSGLVGPLLHAPEFYLVKAFYRRPLLVGGNVYDDYGGRITEILVRPFLCALAPGLSRVYQPLGGECAVRRSVLETLPFASGYGVEIGLLLDFHARYGTHHLAQVDLEKRVHRNRPVNELGKEAFCVLQMLLKKFSEQKVVSFSTALQQIMISPNGGNKMQETEIREVEIRPKCTYAVPSDRQAKKRGGR